VWDDEVGSNHKMFGAEDGDHHENGDPFEDHEDRNSSPHASVNICHFPLLPHGSALQDQEHRRSRRASLRGGPQIS